MTPGWSPDQCPEWCEVAKCRYSETGAHAGPTQRVSEPGRGHASVRLTRLRGERGTWIEIHACAGLRSTVALRPDTAAEHAEHLLRLLVTVAPELVPPLMNDIAKFLAEAR